jgi:hypothetical protein
MILLPSVNEFIRWEMLLLLSVKRRKIFLHLNLNEFKRHRMMLDESGFFLIGSEVRRWESCTSLNIWVVGHVLTG